MSRVTRSLSRDSHNTEQPATDSRPVVNAGSARSKLLTVLAEMVHPTDEPVWTSTLVYVLTGLGLEEQTARQAIARGASSGWIESVKVGRETRWHLTAAGRQLIDEGLQRVVSVQGADDRWDGNWLILMVSVPQQRRVVRKNLYRALSWAGFGNPTPVLWVSPHSDRQAEAKRVIDDLKLTRSTVSFVGKTTDIGMTQEEVVRQAWNLDEVAAEYESLLVRFAGARPTSGDGVLFAHLELVNSWQRLPFMDPQLPEELLPDWIGRRAARVIEQQRSEWGSRARERWAQVVADTAPDRTRS